VLEEPHGAGLGSWEPSGARTDLAGSVKKVVMSISSDPRRDLSDRELMSRSLGDGRYFATVFDRHYDRIWCYLSRRADPVAADDLASETFVRAFAGRAGYDQAQLDASPWLYGIATNLLRERNRGEGRRWRAYSRAIESDALEDGYEQAHGRIDAGALAPALVAALASLAPNDRDALLLLALTDLSYEEIAVATGAPVGTVRSRLHRARRHMQLELEGATTVDFSNITEPRSRQ
jgi:RNA polymerase sigma factor (sigma-70 family)